MFDLHLAQDGRSIVGNGDIAVGGDEDLVETAGAEGGFDDVCHCEGHEGEASEFRHQYGLFATGGEI